MEFGERFSVLQKLGQGGMGIVYRVFDHSRSLEVALKVLHLDQSHPQAQTRFKREFRAAARLDHPACVPVFDMGSIGELSYFTMEYARGGSLAHAGELSARQIAGVALQILAALDHIHSKQIIHRDIKPHNVLLDTPAQRGAEVPRVKVSDFGIATMSDSRFDLAGRGFVGSLPYLAPEQLTEGHADARTDLYALGVVLYELLAHRLPFEPVAKTGVEAWARVISSASPPPFAGDVPGALVRFVTRLLDPRPERRFATAAAAFDELESWSRSQAEVCVPPLPKLVRSSYLATPPFVGRAREIAVLETEIRSALTADVDNAGRKFVLLLTGEAGIGKTRLMHHAARVLESTGALTYTGHCRAEGGNPFEPLAGLFVACGLADPRSPSKAGAHGSLATEDPKSRATDWKTQTLGDVRRTVRRLTNVFDSAVMLGGGSEISPSFSEPHADELPHMQHWQLCRYIADQVLALSRSRPLAVIVEDAHWADSSTLELLTFLVRSAATAGQSGDRFPILVLLTRRPSPEPAALRDLEDAARAYGVGSSMTIGPLDLRGTRELAAAALMTPPDATVDALSAWLTEHAKGNPLYIAQMLHALHASGRLTRVGEKWQVELGEIRSVDLPTTIRNAIGDRASRFATNTKRTLASAAVLGRVFHLHILAEISDIEPLVLLDCLDEAIRAGFVAEVEGDSECFQFSHDQIREAIYDQFPRGEAEALHRRVMLALEERFGEADAMAAMLAHHSLQCGEPEKSYRYHRIAAQHAAEEHAFAKATEFYLLALELAERAALDVPSDLHLALGHAALQCGRYEIAEASYRRRLDALSDAMQRADVLSAIAELEYRRGKTVESGELLEQVLTTVGCDVPKSRSDIAVGLVKNVVIAVRHAVAPRKTHRQEDDQTLTRQIVARACGSLPEVFYFHDSLRALLYNFVGLNVAQEIGPGRELAHACAQQGTLLGMFGLHRAASYYHSQAIEALKASGSPIDHAWAAIMRGLHLGCLAHTDEQLRESELAYEHLTKCTDPHRLREAFLNICEAGLTLGDLPRAERAALEVLRLAEELRDPRGKAWGLYLLGTCAIRHPDHARACALLNEASELAKRSGDPLFHLAAEGRITLELALHGDLEQAVERGTLAAAELARRDLRYPYLFVDGPFLAAAALLRTRDGKVRSDVTALVRRVRWLRRGAARAMRATLPMYLAGLGAWDIACGQRARGIRVLAQAVRIAEAHGLRSCLLDVHAVGAAILTSDEPSGRWHTRGREQLTLAFTESRSLQPPPQAAQKMAS